MDQFFPLGLLSIVVDLFHIAAGSIHILQRAKNQIYSNVHHFIAMDGLLNYDQYSCATAYGEWATGLPSNGQPLRHPIAIWHLRLFIHVSSFVAQFSGTDTR